MNRSEIEHILRSAAAILNEKEFVVVGSQAILGAYPDAPGVLTVSREADLYPLHDPDRADVLSAVLGEESNFHDAFGVYADGVSEGTAVLPAGWRERLIKIQNENTNGAIGWCLDPTDLAIAKHVAGREKDNAFTSAMVKHGFVDVAAFLERLAGMDLPPEQKATIRGRFEGQLRRTREQPRGDV